MGTFVPMPLMTTRWVGWHSCSRWLGVVGILAGCNCLGNRVLPALLMVVEIHSGVGVGVVGMGNESVLLLLRFSGTCVPMLSMMSPL